MTNVLGSCQDEGDGWWRLFETSIRTIADQLEIEKVAHVKI